jgi:hypothetical protein
MLKRTFAALTVGVFLLSMLGEANATVITGSITNWEADAAVFEFDKYVGVNSDLEGWWTLYNLLNRGYVYGFNSSTDVALATGITNISDVVDASIYNYDPNHVGPVNAGTFVIFHNTISNYYGAFQILDIYKNGTHDPDNIQHDFSLDATWYFQDDGTGNFSPTSSVPEPPFFLLFGISLGVLGFTAVRRKITSYFKLPE